MKFALSGAIQDGIAEPLTIRATQTIRTISNIVVFDTSHLAGRLGVSDAWREVQRENEVI